MSESSSRLSITSIGQMTWYFFMQPQSRASLAPLLLQKALTLSSQLAFFRKVMSFQESRSAAELFDLRQVLSQRELQMRLLVAGHQTMQRVIRSQHRVLLRALLTPSRVLPSQADQFLRNFGAFSRTVRDQIYTLGFELHAAVLSAESDLEASKQLEAALMGQLSNFETDLEASKEREAASMKRLALTDESVANLNSLVASKANEPVPIIEISAEQSEVRTMPTHEQAEEVIESLSSELQKEKQLALQLGIRAMRLEKQLNIFRTVANQEIAKLSLNAGYPAPPAAGTLLR